jgi:hypothetical protein
MYCNNVFCNLSSSISADDTVNIYFNIKFYLDPYDGFSLAVLSRSSEPDGFSLAVLSRSNEPG